ncbi:heme oxygenase-like, multi-helical, HAD-like domain protein [Artemisia annua]|uniref:Heme oxygenase-like, multi-helical, HAD-like domain protein n=1 Tax=Artemisia annua TaxID=35608 RepID=A0A2U1PNY5_ARTAN|nr:heme oxygenase-like, multi-helical, HAD-like domain protein [Artemisia annua]
MTKAQNTNDEEGFAKRLWAKFSKESVMSLYTPFVVALASGTLKVESFRHYIAQDVHFLKCFAQAYELAEECADDDDAKVSISDLRRSVLEELEMHGSFCQEWGFDVSKETMPNSATLKYTDFLLATASGKIEGANSLANLTTPFEKTIVSAYTIGAMVPCMRLYAFIGKKLESLVDNYGNHHPYKKWIDNYASEGFQAAALQTEDLLDKMSVTLTGEELDIMQKLYHQAMKLEMDFFLAQPVDQRTVLPLSKDHNCVTIFSDFDLTCTVVDSCTILAEIAMATSPKSGQLQPEGQNQITQMPLTDLRNTWEALSKQYTEEYEHIMQSILVKHKAEKFDLEGLREALEQLSDFEKSANMRVIESEILKGLNLEDIRGAGERLVFQDGCLEFFKSIRNNDDLNAEVHVLSFCWCSDLIRSAFSSGGIDDLQLHANELIYEGHHSTGEIIKKVESPIDKLQAFNNILKERDQKNLTIYIGDSIGDLLCLLEADIGIVIGSSSSLRRLGSHFGVSFVPLYDGLVKKQRELVEGSNVNWKGLSGVVYTVSSWDEIFSFVIGC